MAIFRRHRLSTITFGKGIQMYRYMSCSSLIFLGIVMCVTCLITGRRWDCCGKCIQMYRYMSCSSPIYLGIVMCVTCLITGRRWYCCSKGIQMYRRWYCCGISLW